MVISRLSLCIKCENIGQPEEEADTTPSAANLKPEAVPSEKYDVQPGCCSIYCREPLGAEVIELDDAE